MITGREIGPAGLAEVTEALPEVVPEGERLPEATRVETLELMSEGETVARIREAVPAETDGLTAAEIQERMELTPADVNWKAREAERAANGGESSMQRKRRLRKARLARKIQGWLIGCWPETDEDARVGCRRCEYRVKKKSGADGDGSGGDVAETELAGCEGVEEAMVPIAMLEDLRELLKLVRENLI